MPKQSNTVTRWATLLAVAAGLGSPPHPALASSQDEGAPASQPQKDSPASLDELLGIGGDESARSAAEAARRDTQEELRRQLADTKVTDALEVAFEKMLISAELLEEELDSGLGTQRLQEEILAKLDQLIDQARRQQLMAMASSSPSGSSRRETPRQTPPADQSKNVGGQPNARSSDSRTGGPPPRQDGDINRVLDETRSEWGHLPRRIRDMLLQGRNDRFSGLYRRLTEEYYRRLAEEGS